MTLANNVVAFPTPTMPNAQPLAFVSSAAALASYALACTSDAPADYKRAAHDLATALRAAKATTVAPMAAEPAQSAPVRRGRAAKVVTLAERLLAALQPVVGVVERRNSIPVLSNVRMVSDGHYVTFYGTDLDMIVRQSVKVEGFPVLDITLPATSLVAALKAKGDVTAEFREDDPRLHLMVDGLANAIPTLPSPDFPMMAPKPFGCIINMPAGAFTAALRTVQANISTEETRYYLNGAFLHYVHVDGVAILRLASTDGHRMTRQDIPGVEMEGEMVSAIIPRKAVAWMVKHAGEGEVMVELNAQHIRVTCAGGEMITKVIDGSFPDYNRVIPCQDLAHPFVELLSADAIPVIQRMAAQSSERSRSIKLTMAGGLLEGRIRTMEAGQFEGLIPTTATKGEIEIGLNAAYLLDALRQGDRVRLRFEDGSSPVRIEFPDDAGRIAVIMPLRV